MYDTDRMDFHGFFYLILRVEKIKMDLVRYYPVYSAKQNKESVTIRLISVIRVLVFIFTTQRHQALKKAIDDS